MKDDSQAWQARRERGARLASVRRWLRRRPRLAAFVLAAPAMLGLAFVAGFTLFLAQLDRRESNPPRRADAIVALTGGADRLADALELLDRHQARRLLITGVNNSTSAETLRRRLPGRDALFDCCIDLDYKARNTAGNALETRLWSERHGFRSIIVVTSAYHMPRTLVELRGQMPGADLIPHAVVAPHAQVDRWWHDPEVARVLLSEYVKFVAASLRQRVLRTLGDEEQTLVSAARQPGG